MLLRPGWVDRVAASVVRVWASLAAVIQGRVGPVRASLVPVDPVLVVRVLVSPARVVRVPVVRVPVGLVPAVRGPVRRVFPGPARPGTVVPVNRWPVGPSRQGRRGLVGRLGLGMT
ncbi:hypothetical protein Actkin_00860 [Actinokineospora sp. UTMC 2448]|nr:hypothetical protein Actkin_00860 [Actinokineospora sp. UTMC 2448]